MSKLDSQLVDRALLQDTVERLKADVKAGLEHLTAHEPELALFLRHMGALTAGELLQTGASRATALQTQERLLFVALAAVLALRRGHYDLWAECMAGAGGAPRSAAEPSRN